MELTTMTALELGRAIQAGQTTSVQAVEAVLDAARATQSLNAYAHLDTERALHLAQQADRAIAAGALTGPLAGVPIAIKDNICENGVLTTCASKILEGFRPPYDATVLEKLLAAGMVPVGKANMDEFAMGSTTETSYYGPTRNPWNPDHVPGGSSGGAAAAVAARSAVCALGSDTGGSIRQPASFCGITGMKPTYGTVSRYGLIAYASSLDQIGPMARDAADCAAILDIISGKDPKDATSLDRTPPAYLANLTTEIAGLRVGLPEECFGDGLAPEVRDGALAAAETLQRLGATVERFPMPWLKYAVPTYYILATAEASSNLSRFDGVKYGYRAEDYEDLTGLYCKTRTEGFGEELRRRILLGTFVLSTGYYDAYYKKALQVKKVIHDGFNAAFANYDLILCPAAPTTAPRLGESLSDPLKMYLSDIFTVSVNLAGLPGISVPCGFDGQGLPIGAQFIGAPLQEQMLLNAAHAYQQATDYHRRQPAVAKGV